MKKPDFMILICNSYRVAGDAQGACNRKGATSLLQYISEGCSDRSINAVVSTTACSPSRNVVSIKFKSLILLLLKMNSYILKLKAV